MKTFQAAFKNGSKGSFSFKEGEKCKYTVYTKCLFYVDPSDESVKVGATYALFVFFPSFYLWPVELDTHRCFLPDRTNHLGTSKHSLSETQ